MAYSPDRDTPVEEQLLAAMEYLISDGITVVADIPAADVNAIVDGIIGAGDKTLSDLNTLLTTISSLIDGVGSHSLHAFTKVTTGQINSPTASNGIQLAASSTPYKKARVTAYKESGAAHTVPAANTGLVYVGVNGADECSDAVPLSQGVSMDLPDNGDLTNIWLFADNTGDGVVVEYSE